MNDSRQKEAVAELTAEADNLRAAWDWAISCDDIARVCQVSTALWHLFELRTWLAEGETIFRNAGEIIQSRVAQITPGAAESAAVHTMRAHSAYFSFRIGKAAAAYAVLLPAAAHLRGSADQSAAIYALWYLGITCWELGRFAEANEHLQASLEKARACDQRWWMTLAGEFIGIVAHAMGDYGRARRHLAQALASARSMGDPMLIAHVLVFYSQTIMALGEPAEAGESLRESLAMAQEIGYRHGIGRALDGLGQLAQATSPNEARTLFAASCEVFREIGDLAILSVVLGHQGFNSLAMGDVGGAQDSFLEVLRLARDGGYKPFALDALAGLAIMWAEDSDPERALGLVGLILEHPAATHTAKSRADRLRAELESRLTPGQIQAVKVQAQKQNIDQVVSQVLRQTRHPNTQ
jgi:tetratricopeptide (TPR) repeat protein